MARSQYECLEREKISKEKRESKRERERDNLHLRHDVIELVFGHSSKIRRYAIAGDLLSRHWHLREEQKEKKYSGQGLAIIRTVFVSIWFGFWANGLSSALFTLMSPSTFYASRSFCLTLEISNGEFYQGKKMIYTHVMSIFWIHTDCLIGIRDLQNTVIIL